MTINELAAVLTSPDSIRVVKGDQQLYVGYLGLLKHGAEGIDWERIGISGEEEVKRFRLEPNISHKKYKELQLIPPYEPDRVAEYRFSDLQMTIYYTIYI